MYSSQSGRGGEGQSGIVKSPAVSGQEGGRKGGACRSWTIITCCRSLFLQATIYHSLNVSLAAADVVDLAEGPSGSESKYTAAIYRKRAFVEYEDRIGLPRTL
ncbi:hypothetical protein AFLA_003986 [Aspergillus flavus NRRL3357]|nr:hypothetical protein AFLA_003986 [Aspergillus flavus NRRL3357]